MKECFRYKVGKRVFQLEKIENSNCNQNIIAAIIDILDLGGKFVPTSESNIIDS